MRPAPFDRRWADHPMRNNMTKKSKGGAKPSSKTNKASAKLKTVKRKAVARDNTLTRRAEAAAATFAVSRAAAGMATLDAATFFARLDNYPRFLRSHAMERRGRRRLFVTIYELIVSLGDRINSEEFIAIAKDQGRKLKGANLDPAAVILRRGMRYEERWQSLPEAEQAQERKAALKLFSQDFAAMRWVLSKGYSVDEVRCRLTSKGDGVKHWEQAWRRREVGDQAGRATAKAAGPARAAAAPSRKVRDVEVDMDWLLDQVMKAIAGEFPVDFQANAKLGRLLYVQFEKDALGKLSVSGARYLGVASRFEGKDGRKRFQQEMEKVSQPTRSAR